MSLWCWEPLTLAWSLGLCPYSYSKLVRFRDVRITKVFKISNHIFIQMKIRIKKF